MKNYHLTNKAIEDLEEIWLYTIETWSETQADAYYHDLIEAIQEIAKHPMYLDRNYDEILIGLYCHKCNKHLIFYHLVDGEVEVIRILHERMDIFSKFGD